MATTEEQRQAAGPAEAPISWFPVTEPEAMDPAVREMAEAARGQLGFVPNIFRVFAWRPERLRLWRAHYDHLMRGPGGLSFAEREMIACVVSAENRCLYCTTSHGYQLRALLGDPVLAERILLDYRRADLDERTRAMLDYALKITRTPEECDAADIERLRALGFSQADVWDIVEIASMFNMTNRFADAGGWIPNPDYHGLAR